MVKCSPAGGISVLGTSSLRSLLSSRQWLLCRFQGKLKLVLVSLCHTSFHCPISVSVFFLANPPVPSWMGDRREHSGDCVPEGELGGSVCEGTLTPAVGGRKSHMSLPS